MSIETFDRLRLPLAMGVGLLLVAAYLLIPRVEAEPTAAASPTVVVGTPGGGVLTPAPVLDTPAPAPTPNPQPTAVVTPSPEPTPTAMPAPTPKPEDEFVADVLACRSITGAGCNGHIDRLRRGDDTFVALVLFDNARSGDVMNAILDGPSGPIDGGAYRLPGSGRGYYYTTFAALGLPSGDYTLTALRNGEAVAQTDLRKQGGANDEDG